MTLKSFGCSFIFGTDLPDDGFGTLRPTPSLMTWPALLAKHLGRQYQCFARPGSGNLQILEQILHHVNYSSDQDLFVIGWSWIDRFDYYNADWNPSTRLSPWLTLMPIDNSSVANTYYKTLHSEYQDKLCSLSYIKLAKDILEQHNIPFIMTYMDTLLFDSQWNSTSASVFLQKSVESSMTLFEGKTFLEWSQHKGFKISDTLHPLEQAHASAADLMISLIAEQNPDPHPSGVSLDKRIQIA